MWWMFFDEEYTTKIGMETDCVQFSIRLLSYLKRINSVLTDLTINYHARLKQDFKIVLNHLIHLKHLAVFTEFQNETNILEDISNSSCQLLSFKFGPTQKVKKLNVRAILQFLKTQSKVITSLDMTFWTIKLVISEKREVFAYLQNCEKLRRLTFHFRDALHLIHDFSVLKENLPRTEVRDLTIYFSECQDMDYTEAWFYWLQDIHPDVKVRFKDLKVSFYNLLDYPEPKHLFKQVVEMDNLKLISGSHKLGWMIDTDWRNLEKINMTVSFYNEDYENFIDDPLGPEWRISFPNLKEAILNVGGHNFLYSNFMAIILGSKGLENLNICFKGHNSISRFDEIDFENQLQNVEYLNLKILSLTCTNSTSSLQPMPYNSLLSLVKKSPKLRQITYDLMTEQRQFFQELGFTIVQPAIV